MNPFARESLKIVDVGVSDNIYVVSSKTVSELQSKLSLATELLREWCDDAMMINDAGLFDRTKSFLSTIDKG
jgi:hypothetical protein